MSDERNLDRLAALARHEAAPPVDITGRVMETIRFAETPEEAPPLQLGGMAVAAAVAVLALAVPAFRAWDLLTDPLVSLISSTPGALL